MPPREHDVAALDDIPVGGMLAVTAGSENVLLTRDNGTVYAVGGTCPHAGGPLAEGARQDDSVICPWHKARFCLRTGALLDPPAVDALPSFAVRVAGGRVLVSVPAMQDKALQAVRTDDNRCFVIVGAGAAGALAAQTLREADFGGRSRDHDTSALVALLSVRRDWTPQALGQSPARLLDTMLI